MNLGPLIEWLILIVGLIFLFYAALVIKNESSEAFDYGHPYSLGPFELKLPTWWGEDLKEESKVQFSRHDTRYDWYAYFEWSNEVYKAEDYVLNFLKLKSIELDPPPESETSSEKSHLIKDSNSLEKIKTYFRIEGTATEDNEDRIYIDMVVLTTENGTLISYNRSSVLNGCVEGPYFEEVLKNLEINT